MNGYGQGVFNSPYMNQANLAQPWGPTLPQPLPSFPGEGHFSTYDTPIGPQMSADQAGLRVAQRRERRRRRRRARRQARRKGLLQSGGGMAAINPIWLVGGAALALWLFGRKR